MRNIHPSFLLIIIFLNINATVLMSQAQKQVAIPDWRIVAFDFHATNIPPNEASYIDRLKSEISYSIGNALFKHGKGKVTILERELYQDMIKEVDLSPEGLPFLNDSLVTKLKKVNGNAGLVGVISFLSSGEIKIMCRVVEIETSIWKAGYQRKIKLDKFRNATDRYADDIGKKLANDLIGKPVGISPWVYMGGICTAITGAILVKEQLDFSSAQNDYDKALTLSDASRLRIVAKEELQDRNLARNYTLVCAGITTALALIPPIIHRFRGPDLTFSNFQSGEVLMTLRPQISRRMLGFQLGMHIGGRD